MPNDVNYVRKIAKIGPTPEDKGVMATVELKIMDNGVVSISGALMGGMGPPDYSTKEVAISAMHRFVAQVMEELTKDSARRARKETQT
jgi:hypothetical protein